MTKKRFRAIWENYFGSFTDEQLLAIRCLVGNMHKNSEWFEYVGRVTDAWVVNNRNEKELPTKTVSVEAAQEQQAVH